MKPVKSLPSTRDARELASSLGASSEASVALLERYAGWLAGPAVERGLLGPREVDRIWPRHLVNCALVASVLPTSGSICDLGSGAGLPGVVLAILRPEQPVVLLEPLLRRATFLSEVLTDLGVQNATLVRARAEEYRRQRPDHAVVVARAVAPLDRLADWAIPLLRPGGELLALKGDTADQELSEARPTLERSGVVDCQVLTLGEGGNVTRAVRVVSPGRDHARPSSS